MRIFFYLFTLERDIRETVTRSDYSRITTRVPRAIQAADYVMKRQRVEQTDYHCDTIVPNTIWMQYKINKISLSLNLNFRRVYEI